MPPGPSRPAAGNTTGVGVPDGEPDEADFEGPATAPLKTSGFQQMGGAIGSAIAGIEQQVFGRPPPGPVLVRHVVPSGMKGPDGIDYVLDFPEDAPGPPPPSQTGSTRIGG
jgi:hypothetical protein